MKSFDLTPTAFLIVAFLTGIAGVLQTPTPNVFLTDEVHARPATVRFFFTGNAVIGILVSQPLTGRSNKCSDHKSLIVSCYLSDVLTCILLAWNHNYFVLLFVNVLPSSFGSTANPQMFAPVHEYADKTGYEAVMFSFFLRTQVSLTWVIGPPLVYVLAMGFSLMIMYLSVATAFIVCDVMAWLFLPSMQKELLLATGTVKAPCRNRRDTLLLFAICILMWDSNSLYIINMSLFIVNELRPPEKLASVMMGTVAGLEIPTMLVVGYSTERLGKRFSMRIAAVGGVCFCTRILMAHSPVIPLGLQLLNTISVGILGGTGISYLQDLIPGQAGSATTLYTNTSRASWIIVGSAAGIVAEIWDYYAMFWFAMMMTITTLFCLLRVKDV